MDDENELLEILAKLDEIMVEHLLENRRLRHVLTVIAEAAERCATDWSGMPANVSIHMACPWPVAFAKETTRIAREVLGNPPKEPEKPT